jgi:hypothetical protein
MLGILLFAFYVRASRVEWSLLVILAHRDR